MKVSAGVKEAGSSLPIGYIEMADAHAIAKIPPRHGVDILKWPKEMGGLGGIARRWIWVLGAWALRLG